MFDRVILPRLGRPRPEVVVGPRHGVDVGIVEIGAGQVMVATMDPLFVVPAYGWERAAWFALHIVASDAATSGIAPQYVTVDLNLPPDLADADLAQFWDAFHQASDRLGLAVVTGHTGRYTGCAFPTIGAATVLGFGARDAYVTPAMIRPGDAIIVTKGAAIETVGQLAVVMRARIEQAFGAPFAREAEALFWTMSVVDDALTAAAVGVREAGVTAMHDATEFGLWGALVEVAQASGVGLCIDQGRIPMPDVVRRLCDWLTIDPYCASSEGTLVIACRPARAGEVLARLRDRGILAAIVGEARPLDAGVVVTEGGRSRPLCYPDHDPFWSILSRELTAS